MVFEANEGIGPMTEILASHSHYDDSVQRGSMQTLCPGIWLNDEVINYYLKNCLAKCDELICARFGLVIFPRKQSHRPHLSTNLKLPTYFTPQSRLILYEHGRVC